MPAKIAQDRNNLAFSLLLATVLLAFASTTASASSIVNTIIGFNGPIGIAVSPFGSQAYVVNNGNNTVSVVTLNGVSGAANAFSFNVPFSVNSVNVVSLMIGNGLAINGANQLYATGTALTANAPIFIDSNNAISITQASATVNGFLSSADWNTFSTVNSRAYAFTVTNMLGYIGNVLSISNTPSFMTVTANIIGNNAVITTLTGNVIGSTASITTVNGNVIGNNAVFGSSVSAVTLNGNVVGNNAVFTSISFTTLSGSTFTGNIVGNNAVLTNIYGTLAGSNTISFSTGNGQTLTANIIAPSSIYGVISGANTIAFSTATGTTVNANTVGTTVSAVTLNGNVVGNNAVFTSISFTTLSGSTFSGNLVGNNAIFTTINAITFSGNIVGNNAVFSGSINVGSCIGCGTGSGVTSINGLTGAVNVVGQNVITAYASSQNVILSIPQATGSLSGYLASGDWTIFNGKFGTAGTGLYASATTVNLAPLTAGYGISIGTNGNTIIATGVPSISAGTGILVNTANQISLIPLTAGTGISIGGSGNTITCTGCSGTAFSTAGTGLYSSGTTVSLAPLTAGFGILVGTNGNTITATGVPSISAGTGIAITTSNQIALATPTNTLPISITSTNNIALNIGAGLMTSAGKLALIPANSENPANPTGTTSSSLYVYMGTGLVGGSGTALGFTPAAGGSGNVMFQCQLDAADNKVSSTTSVTNTISIKLGYGSTGSNPVNGGAVGSNSFIGPVLGPYTSYPATTLVHTDIAQIITGLSPGTKYWVDFAVESSSSSNTGSISNIWCQWWNVG